MPESPCGPKLSKSVYKGLKYGKPLPAQFIEWELVLRTGWTLDYIRSLSMQDIHDGKQVLDGMKKAGAM